MAQLLLLGRALALKPGEYGELFEAACTVKQMVYTRDWVDGVLKESKQENPIHLFWYDTDPASGKKVFCAYSGYARYIQKVLKDRGISVEVVRKTSNGLPPPDLTVAKTVTWRPRQKDVVAKILTYDGGVIVCPTGFGKTFIIKAVARMYPSSKILFTVTTRDVAKRVYADLYETLGHEVGFIGDGKYDIRRVIVCVAKSLHKCPKDFNIVFADECHEMLTLAYLKMLNRFTRAKMFGFTASPEGRSDGTDALAHAIFGPELIRVEYAESVDAGNIVPIQVRLHRVTEGPNLTPFAKDSNLLLRYGIWRNKHRNEYIANTVKAIIQEVGADQQVLVMVDKVEHAFALGQLLPEFTIVTGEVDNDRFWKLKREGIISENQRGCTSEWRDSCLRRFEKGTLKYVISTMVWKQGVDFKDLAVLVRADGLASKINAIQVSGRLSRLGTENSGKEYGILVDFVDEFNPRLLQRSKSRIKVYSNNKWSISIK